MGVPRGSPLDVDGATKGESKGDSRCISTGALFLLGVNRSRNHNVSKVMSGQVMSGQVMSGHVRSC